MIKLFNKNVKSFIITMAMGHLCFAQVINVTDIPISTVVGNNQAENAVFISPLSKYVIINSNNSSPIPNTPVALGDVSYFISTNGGLSWTGNIYGIDPDGYGDPSGREVESDGLDLSAMSSIQMRKIERVFLYLFNFKNIIKELRKENKQLKNKANEFEKRIQKIENGK